METALDTSQALGVPLYELFMVEHIEAAERERFEVIVQIEEMLKGQPMNVLKAAHQQIQALVSLSKV